MFTGKVYGAARERLLLYLVPLYQEGYHCLLRCRSINFILYAIIQRPLLVNKIEARDESEKCQVDVQLILEAWNSKQRFTIVKSEIMKQIQDLDHIFATSNSNFEQEILQLWRNYLIQNQFISCCMGGFDKANEASDRRRQSNIPMMPVIDTIRHLLYTALYHYRRGMYHAVISLLQEVKLKLQHPNSMYVWEGNIEKYRRAGGEQKPFTQMMKEIVPWDAELKTDVTIPELTLEHQAAYDHSTDHTAVSLLVFTNFMFFLCYLHMGIVQDAQSVLQELSVLVQYDNGYHITRRDKAISWQMLGICQDMSGDQKGAYQSYCNALQQKYGKIKSASLMRISVIIHKCMPGRCLGSVRASV